MTHAVNYIGLRKRDTYNELIDYLLDKQPNVIYPDRKAKFIRNSPILSNLLDGDGMGSIYWQEQQINRIKEEQKEHAIQQTGGTAQILRTASQIQTRPERYYIADDLDSDVYEYNDALESVISEEEDQAEKKRQENIQKVKNHLSQLGNQEGGFLLGAEHLLKPSSENGDDKSEISYYSVQQHPEASSSNYIPQPKSHAKYEPYQSDHRSYLDEMSINELRKEYKTLFGKLPEDHENNREVLIEMIHLTRQRKINSKFDVSAPSLEVIATERHTLNPKFDVSAPSLAALQKKKKYTRKKRIDTPKFLFCQRISPIQ